MSFRSWLFITALGLISSVASGQGASDNAKIVGSRESYPAIEHEGAERFSIPVQIIETQEAADSREREERFHRQQQERDLAAQEGMNEATKSIDEATWWMFWVSVFNASFVAAGTALLLWNLCLMRQANIAAIGTLKATQDQLEATRRPRLKIRAEHLIENDGILTAHVAVENAGDSEAEIKYSEFIIHFGDDRPVPRHWSFESPSSRLPDSKILAGGWRKWEASTSSSFIDHDITIMGGILYTKTGDKRTYRTFFCRKYDKERRRFVQIENDPEYERED